MIIRSKRRYSEVMKRTSKDDRTFRIKKRKSEDL
jgi:hypothetical protein